MSQVTVYRCGACRTTVEGQLPEGWMKVQVNVAIDDYDTRLARTLGSAATEHACSVDCLPSATMAALERVRRCHRTVDKLLASQAKARRSAS